MMASSTDSALYDKVVRVTKVYLGPAADRFISRQVQNHLHKPPQELLKSDLVKLIDWIRVSVALLTDDTDLIEEYTARLEQLTVSTPESGKNGP